MEGAITAPTFTEVLAREQIGLWRAGWKWMLAYVAAITVPFVLLDLNYPDAGWSYFWLSVFWWAAGYLLLIMLMDRAGLQMKAGIGSYFAVSFVISVPLGIGFAAFVIPGLYLMLRWLPVYVRCLVTENWIGGSIRWSWDATEPYQKELALALFGPICLNVAGYGAAYGYEYLALEAEAAYFAFILFINLTSIVAYGWILLLGVAAYLVIEQAGTARSATAAG